VPPVERCDPGTQERKGERPEAEENRIVNFDPVNLKLIYAREDGASASVNKQTKYLNFTPRLGITYDVLGDQTTILRTGSASPSSPSSRRRRT